MRTLRGAVGLIALLGLSLSLCGPPARAEQIDPTLDAEVGRLQRLAFDKPDLALRNLHALRRDPAYAAQAQLLRFAEGRIHVVAGNTRATLVIAEALAQDPEQLNRAQLLHAEVAARNGQSQQAASLAQVALDGFEKLCIRGDIKQSIARGCDFRSAWAAVRMLERAHANDGTMPLAEVAARFALELAQAGGDTHLTAVTMSSLARLALAQDQGELALRWITQALQTAQGEAMTMVSVKLSEAALAALRKDPVTQMKALEEGLVLARQADATRTIAMLDANLADSYMHQSLPAKAVVAAQRALPVLLAFRDLTIERVTRHNLSVAYIQLRQFDNARRELARITALRTDQQGQGLRIQELREQGEAWAGADQPKEAIAAFHEERKLTAEVTARNRDASLQQLKLKYDSDGKQRDLDLLTRDQTLMTQQLSNRNLAQQVGIAVAAFFALSLVLGAIMVRRVREANRRLKANETLLRAQSERDPLTDLANRRHFLGVMAQQPQAQFNGALLMVDIDHFKHVNDEHGHAVGDVVICEVARRISHAVRTEDLVVRWGGEEFLVFAPDVSQDSLALLAERILNNVGSTPVATEDGPLRVTVSIGFAHFPLPPARLTLHWEQAVNWADMALYTAKAQGRNRAMGIATVDARDTDALLQIEADFDAACSSERVSLRPVLGPP